LLIGGLVRVPLVPVPGSPDVIAWKVWAFTGAFDSTALYGVGGDPPHRRMMRWREHSGTTEYPPLAIYEISAMGRMYRDLDPAFRDSPTLSGLIKTPGLIAEVSFVAAMLVWARRQRSWIPAWIALAFWLNPAVIINGAALGYLDAQMAVPATLSLVAAAHRRPILAGLLLGIALSTKAQALFVTPVVILTLVTSARPAIRPALLAFGGAVAAVGAVVVEPIIARGAWTNMVQAISRLTAHDMVSGQGLNAWWIVSWIVRALDSLDLGWRRAFTEPVRILTISRFMEVGYPNPKPIGAAIVCLAIAWGIWRARKGLSLTGAALLGAWCVYVYAMFSAQVHENHFYLAVPFLVVAAGFDSTLRPLLWAISAMTAFNMYVFYGLGAPWSPEINPQWTVLDMTVIASFVNVGLLVWLTRRMMAWREPAAAQLTAAPVP
jgi:hypothetical protein